MDNAERAAEPAPTPIAAVARPIGEILREGSTLSSDDMQRIFAYQRDKGVLFGEAAVALGLATPDSVMQALSVQFNYPYARRDGFRWSPELVMLEQPFSPYAEAFRGIRAQIMMRRERRASETTGSPTRRALAVISPNSGDGKTYFAANLAVSFAQLGERTVIVDADLRGPRLHEIFGIDNTGMLSGILSGRAGGQVVTPIANVPNLFVLPGGATPPNPLELLEAAPFGLLLHELLAKFDHVVVDTPAGSLGADAAVIAARCGSALVVARENKVRVNEMQALVQNFSGGTTEIIGVVLNDH